MTGPGIRQHEIAPCLRNPESLTRLEPADEVIAHLAPGYVPDRDQRAGGGKATVTVDGVSRVTLTTSAAAAPEVRGKP